MMPVQVGFGCFFFFLCVCFVSFFSSSPAEIRVFSLCVFICLWAVTFSPPILNSNISPFPPAISRLRCMHIYEAHLLSCAFSFFFFFANVCVCVFWPLSATNVEGEGGNEEK